MDFITKLLTTPNVYDTILVVIDHLTKSAHFLPIKEMEKMEKMEKLVMNYVKEIVWLHITLTSIILDRNI